LIQNFFLCAQKQEALLGKKEGKRSEEEGFFSLCQSQSQSLSVLFEIVALECSLSIFSRSL